MKTAIALLALFAVAANAAITPLEEVQPMEARGNHDTVIVIHKISKEIKDLVQMFEKCQSYESDALKGTCFTKFSLQLAADIKALVEAIQNMSKARNDGWDLTKEITVLLAQISREVTKLINMAHQCQSYDSDSRRATCWTRFSLELASAVANLTNSIIDIVNNQQGNDSAVLSEQVSADVKAVYASIENMTREGGWELTKEITELLLQIKNEVQTLIDIANECQSYESDSRRGTCWTRFSLELASAIANLTNSIIDMVNKG